MTSIRRTLLLALLAAVAAVTLATAFAVYRMARREIDEVFDYHLRQIALTLRDRVPAGGASGGDREAFEFAIQIWSADGVRLYASRLDSGLPEIAELGFATVPTRGGPWRVYSAELSGLVVQVAQPMSIRDRAEVAAASRTLAPVLLVLPLLAFLAWRIVGRTLAPLERLAGAVAARSPGALEPIPEAGAPEEALPLVRSLNQLLGRLSAALAAQRAFVADAAHELRTPLAALALQAQLVERAADPAERAGALADLQSGLGRATRVVQQLLTLARQDPESVAPGRGEPARLAELVAHSIADHALLAESRGIDLGAPETGGDATVMGDAASLRTLLDNLVDNAVRYTPRGGRVDVTAGLDGGRPFLAVADTGPGIPVAERERVFDRFYRLPATAEPGSGLGLAVVKAIALRHGATVTLADTPGGGLTARVVFPATSADPPAVRGGPPAPPVRAG